MAIKTRILKWFLSGFVDAVQKKKANLRTRLVLWAAQRMVDKMKGSWKTTAAGVCAILIAVAQAVSAMVDGKPETSVNIEVLIASISTGIGLILARDNDKTSESVGAKQP